MEMTPTGSESAWRRLVDLVLARDFQQRRRVAMVLTTALLYAACLALFDYGIVFGIFDAARVRLSAILIILTAVFFFTLIRSGWNLRFAEPSLSFPQALVAQTMLSITYSSLGQVQLRTTDIIARWGGEEFLMLLPETSPPGEPNVAVERLREALAVAEASAQVPHLRIAFSTGLTLYIPGEQIDDMVERADRALYAAKAGGRNRTATL